VRPRPFRRALSFAGNRVVSDARSRYAGAYRRRPISGARIAGTALRPRCCASATSLRQAASWLLSSATLSDWCIPGVRDLGADTSRRLVQGPADRCRPAYTSSFPLQDPPVLDAHASVIRAIQDAERSNCRPFQPRSDRDPSCSFDPRAHSQIGDPRGEEREEGPGRGASGRRAREVEREEGRAGAAKAPARRCTTGKAGGPICVEYAPFGCKRNSGISMRSICLARNPEIPERPRANGLTPRSPPTGISLQT